MIALNEIVVEDGKFKKTVTVLEEHEDGSRIVRRGLGVGLRVEQEDLTDEEARELGEALKNLDLQVAPPGYGGYAGLGAGKLPLTKKRT